MMKNTAHNPKHTNRPSHNHLPTDHRSSSLISTNQHSLNIRTGRQSSDETNNSTLYLHIILLTLNALHVNLFKCRSFVYFVYALVVVSIVTHTANGESKHIFNTDKLH